MLTTPPFPYTRKHVAEPVGLPVLFDGQLDARGPRATSITARSGSTDGELVTERLYGWTMVVTGRRTDDRGRQGEGLSRSPTASFVPNLRYRRDIGDRLIAGDLAKIEAMGHFDDV